MPSKKKLHRRKKIRFRKITFKMTTGQYERLTRYCKKHHLTPVRLVRKALNVYLDRFGPELDHVRIPVGKNQLTIFDAGAESSHDANNVVINEEDELIKVAEKKI
ncbi:MAG: hypothetical protein U1C46_11350 [Bacteroidales bacterium]|nr:hypothetical protein [Bacteroidales bacterium]MDZ4205397.1 hypothetical protein [Bacteroidales bacterium]